MVILISLFTFITLVQCEEQLLFAYSCTLPGTSYSTRQALSSTSDTPSGLTTGGIRQLYVLGRELRHRLIVKQSLLDDNYNPRQLRVRPLMIEKAVSSAYALIAGLYPAGTGHIINNHKVRESAIPPNDYDYSGWIADLETGALNYTYQSMPLSMTGKAEDALVSAESECKALQKYILTNDHNWKDELTNERKGIANFFGIKEETIKDVEELSELRELILQGLVEGKYKKSFNEDESTYLNTKKIDEFRTNVFLELENTRKLASTPILRDVMKNMDETYKKDLNKTMTRNELKYISLVGIDRNTLISIARQLGLNIEEQKVPMPASILLFELYKETKDKETIYSVRFTYDKVSNVLYINDFFNKVLSSTFTEEEFADKCSMRESNGDKFNWLLVMIIAIGVVLVVALAIIIKVMITKCKPKETNSEDENIILSELQKEYEV